MDALCPMVSSLPGSFPGDHDAWILRMAGDQPHTVSTFQVELKNGLDRKAETSIAEAIVVQREEVDDRST